MRRRSKIIIGILAGLALVTLLFVLAYVNQPHIDVSRARADVEINIKPFIDEFLNTPAIANDRYFETGSSLIIILEGTVSWIEADEANEVTMALKEPHLPAGMRCLFRESGDLPYLYPGDKVRVKGILISGPAYDEDLKLYEDGYLQDCLIID